VNSRFGIRHLYLLALFQLVAGPLVLFQVTVLCKLTVREAATHGVGEAVVIAWNSPEFHAALAHADEAARGGSRQSLPTSDPKSENAKVKMPVAVWQGGRVVLVNPASFEPLWDGYRTWTTLWPQPPPGPPPRVG
jgi:hypothetical protein